MLLKISSHLKTQILKIKTITYFDGISVIEWNWEY